MPGLEKGRVYRSPVCHGPARMFPTVKNPQSMMSPTMICCLRRVLRQPCLRSDLLRALKKGTEGGDGQTGREEEGVEDER